MKVYVAGPMSGIPEFNFPAFHAAAAVLRDYGLEVMNPAEMNLELDPETTEPEEYIRRDLLAIVAECDGMALLPEWHTSVGARCEVAVAITLGFAFYSVYSGERLHVTPAVCIAHGYPKRVTA